MSDGSEEAIVVVNRHEARGRLELIGRLKHGG